MSVRGINEAKVGPERHPYIDDFFGEHAVVLRSATSGVSTKPSTINKEYYALTFDVALTSSEELDKLKGGASKTTVTLYRMNHGYPGLYWGPVKKILAAIVGKNAQDESVDWAPYAESLFEGKYNDSVMGLNVFPSGKVRAKGAKVGVPWPEISVSKLKPEQETAVREMVG